MLSFAARIKPSSWKRIGHFHGNDTGADLLEAFRRWNKRNRSGTPTKFLADLLARWDVKPIDWGIVDEDAVKKLHKKRPVDLSLCNEAAIALAFAVIKLRASCPPDVVQLAKNALERTSILVNSSPLSKQVRDEWDVAMTKTKTKLDLTLT
jgi:hypothetical protein